MKKFRKEGFTLIELLVVIAIIAILAAILFPVFARVREKARQSACISNIKQLLLSFHMYTQDYDERLPHYGDPAKINANGIAYLDGNIGSEKTYACFGWGGAPSMGPGWITNAGPDPSDDALWQQPRPLTPYVKDSNVYICPDQSGSVYYAPANWGSGYQTHTAVLGNTYAINTRLIFPSGWTDGRNQGGDNGFGYTTAAQNSASLSSIIQPTSTALIADGYMDWPGRAGINSPGTSGMYHEGTALAGGNGPYLQQASCVYGFVDGHAKYMNPGGCFYTNAAELYGGKVSFFDDNYKTGNWNPGSYPPNTNWDSGSCK